MKLTNAKELLIKKERKNVIDVVYITDVNTTYDLDQIMTKYNIANDAKITIMKYLCELDKIELLDHYLNVYLKINKHKLCDMQFLFYDYKTTSCVDLLVKKYKITKNDIIKSYHSEDTKCSLSIHHDHPYKSMDIFILEWIIKKCKFTKYDIIFHFFIKLCQIGNIETIKYFCEKYNLEENVIFCNY